VSARRARKRIYLFGGAKAEGRAEMKELLGGKGANLAEMTRLGLPVPPGFTISTAVCAEYNAAGGQFARPLVRKVRAALKEVEDSIGLRFGDAGAPLLVSVRSGARASMPGMMDTVLNLGLNRETAAGLAKLADERFAYDSFRRFVQMYSDVVLGVPVDAFEHRLEVLKARRGVALDTELNAADWRGLLEEYLRIVEDETGKAFPEDPEEQLWGAISAVFRSWENTRAVRYRRLHDIPDSWGTAVNVQAMVFGNAGDDCATGVAFTRDPSTGEKVFYGEYLSNAQGEDVVAGIRTPQPLNRESRGADTRSLPTLEEEMPRPYRELARIRRTLERHYRDMQDIEFTIQAGKLWMLQTRSGKRTVRAAVKIAVDMAREHLITRREALLRVDAGGLEQLLHPSLDPAAPRNVIAKGLPASPGAACGSIVFSADEAETKAKTGEKVLLVRIETSPEDIHGMDAAEGILTARGGMTSHAAVVARGMGKSCVAGCGELRISYERGELQVGDTVLRAGDELTIDGSTGEVIPGSVPTVTPELGPEFNELMRWADRERRLEVRTNADSPGDAEVARSFGAQGIGLCRTEHMFFEKNRIRAVREMILADDAETRREALATLLPMQRGDFEGIFRAMDGLPVTVRLLDPPLHEFLPADERGVRELAAQLGAEVPAVRARVEALREFNPMLGHRGCRLGLTFPEIYEMQARAISEAACRVAAEGVRVVPEVMIPLVAHAAELRRLRAQVEKTVEDVLKRHQCQRLRVEIGTMIEVPRAALTADEIAEHADFFSFGTNDMTQMAYALSRDDAGKFLPDYLESGILDDDPFVSIDRRGIGALVRIGTEKGRAVRPDLKVGVCGEHGGDAKSVKFFHEVGLDYVSCSPFRVPVARLAAAQAAIEEDARPRRKPAARKRVAVKGGMKSGKAEKTGKGTKSTRKSSRGVRKSRPSTRKTSRRRSR
jgi:pyruvate,orthophosphate dikinase